VGVLSWVAVWSYDERGAKRDAMGWMVRKREMGGQKNSPKTWENK